MYPVWLLNISHSHMQINESICTLRRVKQYKRETCKIIRNRGWTATTFSFIAQDSNSQTLAKSKPELMCRLPQTAFTVSCTQCQ